jgi:hypothetical protein
MFTVPISTPHLFSLTLRVIHQLLKELTKHRLPREPVFCYTRRHMSPERYEAAKPPTSAKELKEQVNKKGEENLDWFSDFMEGGMVVCDVLGNEVVAPRLLQLGSACTVQTLLKQSDYFHIVAGSGLNPRFAVELTPDEQAIVRDVDSKLAAYIEEQLAR